MIPLRDDNPHRGTPIVTGALIAVNGIVFAFQSTLPPDQIEAFFQEWAFVPGRLTADGHIPWGHQILTLFTSMFLHGGFMHLLGNMWSLWIFGDNVEHRLGHGRYLVLYLGSGLAAGVSHWVLHSGSEIPTVGASGAISGVMGAYVIMFPHASIVMLFPLGFVPYFFRIKAWVYLVFWFGLQLVSSAATLGRTDGAGVAYGAHAGGFVAGIVLGYLLQFPRRPEGPAEPEEVGFRSAWGSGRGTRRKEGSPWVT